MRRLALWVLVTLTGCAAAWAAPASPPPQVSSPAMKDLQQDLTLGSELMERQGTPEQLGSLQKLSERGLKAAREAAVKSPKSPEAQYVLGSWLLYGYRVVMSDRITYDTKGEEHTDKVPRVIQGLGSDQSEGLSAMKRASDLSAGNGHYIVEYGAALIHANRSREASGVLKKAWAEGVQTSPQDRVRAAMLMSDVDAGRGDLAGARGWLYRALLENRENTGAVERLRKLDSRQAAAEGARNDGSAAGEGSAASDEDQSLTPDESSGASADSGGQTSDDEGIVIEAPEPESSAGGADESPSTGGSDTPGGNDASPDTSGDTSSD